MTSNQPLVPQCVLEFHNMKDETPKQGLVDKPLQTQKIIKTLFALH
jgi:hypothetical protein